MPTVVTIRFNEISTAMIYLQYGILRCVLYISNSTRWNTDWSANAQM